MRPKTRRKKARVGYSDGGTGLVMGFAAGAMRNDDDDERSAGGFVVAA